MTYAEKLKHPKWQQRRLQLLESAKWKCERCSTKEVTLHVHHHFYRSRANPWDYPDYAYVVLCENCHADAEQENKQFKEHIECLYEIGNLSVDAVVGFIKALRMQHRVQSDPSYTELIQNRAQAWGFARAYQADERDLLPLLNNGEVWREMTAGLWRKHAERLQARLAIQDEYGPDIDEEEVQETWALVVNKMALAQPLRTVWLEKASGVYESDGCLHAYFPPSLDKVLLSPLAREHCGILQKLWEEATGRPVHFLAHVKPQEVTHA